MCGGDGCDRRECFFSSVCVLEDRGLLVERCLFLPAKQCNGFFDIIDNSEPYTVFVVH